MNYRTHPEVQRASQALRNGRVIAYPTEAVWGLGCDPFNRQAAYKILKLKSRPVRKGLIIVAANTEQLSFLLAPLQPEQLTTLYASWPGPNTWLIPHHGAIPPWVCGEHNTVAVRVSAHPVVQALCESFGGPIVSTSANPQGLCPAKFACQARKYFANAVTYAPGKVDINATPSRIRDLISGQTLRA